MAKDIEESCIDQFQKIFVLQEKKNFIPSPESLFTSKLFDSDPEFQLMKEELNNVKGLLNSMLLAKWHKHTKFQNPADLIIGEVRRQAKAELLTQAFLKFTEILCRFPGLIPDNENEYNTLHLCEAPGAFITALNHQIKTTHTYSKLKWNWNASTLNPYYEGNTTASMINDDRFILRTLDKWNFGLDDTGDILDKQNLQSFVDKYSDSISLVTADGSIDCQIDPARQEELVVNLHLAEIIGAIGTLKIGGNFVLKMFTFFESTTLCHLYLLAGLFQKLTVFKPATSKEGNSEVYLICESFEGVSKSMLKVLSANVKETNHNLFGPEDIAEEFKEKVKKCSHFFKDIQVNVIKRNIFTFENEFDRQAVKELKEKVVQRFLNECNIKMIEQCDYIVPDSKNLINHTDACRHLDDRQESGTFLDKLKLKTKAQKVDTLKYQLSRLYPSWFKKFRRLEWASTYKLNGLSHLTFLNGRSFDIIQSSKFCPGKALKLYQDSYETYDQEQFENDNHSKRQKLDSSHQEFELLADCFNDDPFLHGVTEMYPEILENDVIVISLRTTKNLLQRPDAMEGQKMMKRLIQAISSLKRGQHLILVNLVFLTRLQVGILYLLAYHFEEVGFIRPFKTDHGIFLSEFKGNNEKLLEYLTSIETNLTNELLSILSTEFITQEPLYSLLVAHNINIIRESSLAMLFTNDDT